MDKFSVDYQVLGKKIEKKKAYRFEEVKDRLEKVAFDVVRFKDSDDIDGLWQIQATDDGEVIVAMYADEKPLESKSSWKVLADKTGSNLSIFYKSEPVVKMAAASLGIPCDDTDLLCRTLTDGLDKNVVMRNAFINELSVEERDILLQKHPELNS
jgi:hypothetical protein